MILEGSGAGLWASNRDLMVLLVLRCLFYSRGSRFEAHWQAVMLKVQLQSGINKDCLKVAFQNFPPY